MTTTMTKTRTRTTAHANEKYELSKGMIATLSVVPGLVGIWAAACFVGAMVTSGGPYGLIRNYFQAITGM